jgi:hypothetical protein
MGCSTTSSGRTAGDAGREADERAVGGGVGSMATATWTAGAAETLGAGGAGDTAEA